MNFGNRRIAIIAGLSLAVIIGVGLVVHFRLMQSNPPPKEQDKLASTEKMTVSEPKPVTVDVGKTKAELEDKLRLEKAEKEDRLRLEEAEKEKKKEKERLLKEKQDAEREEERKKQQQAGLNPEIDSEHPNVNDEADEGGGSGAVESNLEHVHDDATKKKEVSTSGNDNSPTAPPAPSYEEKELAELNIAESTIPDSPSCYDKVELLRYKDRKIAGRAKVQSIKRGEDSTKFGALFFVVPNEGDLRDICTNLNDLDAWNTVGNVYYKGGELDSNDAMDAKSSARTLNFSHFLKKRESLLNAFFLITSEQEEELKDYSLWEYEPTCSSIEVAVVDDKYKIGFVLVNNLFRKKDRLGKIFFIGSNSETFNPDEMYCKGASKTFASDGNYMSRPIAIASVKIYDRSDFGDSYLAMIKTFGFTDTFKEFVSKNAIDTSLLRTTLITGDAKQLDEFALASKEHENVELRRIILNENKESFWWYNSRAILYKNIFGYKEMFGLSLSDYASSKDWFASPATHDFSSWNALIESEYMRKHEQVRFMVHGNFGVIYMTNSSDTTDDIAKQMVDKGYSAVYQQYVINQTWSTSFNVILVGSKDAIEGYVKTKGVNAKLDFSKIFETESN